MEGKQIYNLAETLDSKIVELFVQKWKTSNQKSEGCKCIDTYNSLIKLGDSPELACATVIASIMKENTLELEDIYELHYS